MSEREHTVVVTDADIRFIERAVEHYGLFADTAERQGEKRTAGILRKQKFYGERMLVRLQEGVEAAP